MKRVRVNQLPLDGPVALDPIAAHHLANVLRARVGADLLLFDGRGLEQPATVASLTPVTASPTGPCVERTEGPPLHLFLSVLKHQPMDLALRMATEAGATELHPVVTERTIAKGNRSERWAKILTSAASQCGRATVPVLHPVHSLHKALSTFDGRLVFGRMGAERPTPSPQSTGVVIGPAGGLSPREEDFLSELGADPIGLGPHILRAETAVAVAVALLR